MVTTIIIVTILLGILSLVTHWLVKCIDKHNDKYELQFKNFRRYVKEGDKVLTSNGDLVTIITKTLTTVQVMDENNNLLLKDIEDIYPINN